MSNELLVAFVGLIGSLCGSVIGVVGSARVLTYRVAQLEEKLKKQCDNCAVMDVRVDRLVKSRTTLTPILPSAHPQRSILLLSQLWRQLSAESWPNAFMSRLWPRRSGAATAAAK